MSAQTSQSNRLIEALRNPAAYSHPVNGVELLQTHISWVLLAGGYAYKIKKPVDMGFLDFTTLARRKFYCIEELRLNRRLAPELYLEVVPITGSEEEPKMGGDGEPIEYVVQMRRFPQEALLSRVLQRNELSPAHIDELAEEVAEFHGRVAVAPPEGRFAALENIRHANEEILQCLEVSPEYAARVQQLAGWCRDELTRHEDDFRSRGKLGFVRECHGDMHLGNMLLLEGRPVIFDCLEFNEDLRWIDIQSEIAFTTMDLEDRGSPALAHRFANAWLEQTGDYAGLIVSRYYQVYRAIVRAKVARLRLAQPALTAEEKRSVLAEYEGYLQLADRFTRPSCPSLIITHGLSGSGKTTLTQPVLEALGGVRIRSDVERKRLFGLKPRQRSGSSDSEGLYTPQATERAYARLAELANSVLRAGFPLIIDATFLRRAERERFRQLATQRAVPFTILDFQASEQVLRNRILQRAHERRDASEADFAVLVSQQRSQDPLEADELTHTIPVDSEAPDAATHAIAALRKLIGPL